MNDAIDSTSLPDDFDPWKHLQKQYNQQHNLLVRKYFSDHDDNWVPNIGDPRSSLRVACTMTDSDNDAIRSMRHNFFYDLLGYARKNLLVYYGSRESIDPPVEGHPKIVFYFSQDSESVPATQDYKADAEYSVRLMTLENTSINLHEKLVEIANEIKTQFVHNKQGIVHAKGNLCVSYKDPKHGFPNGSKILSNNEADGISIYQKICNVVDVPFDELKINVGNPKKPSTTGTVTETQVIMGKTRKKRAYRRVVNIQFRYAYALIPGEPQPVFLIDTTQRYKPLVKI
ncbi:hypothetical protein [Nostoc sp. ChiVER01]|uniref:hypothetical protein n=1 Tax=Nostoc sp. ChiVER01 TaxID=3075382 RepID=UPI002AD358A6|nr:hypothetical protein [Nostoc sp. ChiVER01]MDZ8228298.1 hypothetical protein [Nostoc sp. ChiVER01]